MRRNFTDTSRGSASMRRERERVVDQWMETASMSSREVDVAEREAQRAREASSRLESEIKRLSNSLADLNTSYR